MDNDPRPGPPDIAIVTDSTSDIPNDFRIHCDIHVIPNIIILDGKSLADEVDITRKEFYQYLAASKELPTTATASSGAYQKKYEALLSQGYQHILSIHPPGHLSGIYNAAWIASQEFPGRVTVIDSQQLTLGQGFQVMAAAEAAQRGGTLPEVLSVLSAVRQRIRLIAMLDTLEYIRRSGRVSWARARLGELLRIKPFVEVRDGQVLSLGETRTTQKGLSRLKELLLNLGPLEKLAILHSNAEEQAGRFLSELPGPLPKNPILVNITSVIGTHVGPNGIGFVAVLR
jgi:DegV family protein with EDD domain